MAAKLIDGKKLASVYNERLRPEIRSLKSEGIQPCLAIIYNGSDFSARKYVVLKKKISIDLGINIITHDVYKDTPFEYIKILIDRLNSLPAVNGILIQLPLLSVFDEKNIMSMISPEKDIDCCAAYSLGRLIRDAEGFVPCASFAVIKMLRDYDIDIAGKKAVVVTENDRIGKTVALLLLKHGAIVTLCNTDAPDFTNVCLQAQILCVTVGKVNMITGNVVGDKAVVFDMGMHVTSGGKAYGYIHSDSVKQKASYMTPVPGGVGPMTVAMIMRNTVTAAKMQMKGGELIGRRKDYVN